MALVSNNSAENTGEASPTGDLAGIIQESKTALAGDEKALNGAAPKKKGRGRPSKASKEAEAAAALPPPPFEPKPAGYAPLIAEGVFMLADTRARKYKVPEIKMEDKQASEIADHLDMALGCVLPPEVNNSPIALAVISVIMAGVSFMSFNRMCAATAAEKKKNEFKAEQSPGSPVFAVPTVNAPAPQSGAIQTHL